MKTFNYFLLIGLTILFTSFGLKGQPAQKDNSDRKALLKEMKERPGKEAVKQAKEYKKQGYKEFIGDPPMAKQIENSWIMALKINELGYSEYIMGGGEPVTGGSASVAKMQATHAAKLFIAGQISSKIASLIKSSAGNKEISTAEAKTMNEYLQASQELIVADLEQVQPVLQLFRESSNNNVQVVVRLAYSTTKAIEAAKQRMQQDMKNEIEDLHRKLEQVYNLQRLPADSDTGVN